MFAGIKDAIGDNGYFIGKDELNRINESVWHNNDIVRELWRTNRYMYSEIQMLKNAFRRHIKSTVFDFHFEFHLVEHCNLKCAGCTHFAPLAEESFLDPEEFKKDINRLSELTGGNTRFINLLGGEPLLHPRICEFIKYCREAFPKTIIRVVTNGILLKDMPRAFWEHCQNYSIVIGITRYPIGVDYESVIGFLKKRY